MWKQVKNESKVKSILKPKGIIINRSAHGIKDILDALDRQIRLTDERVAKNNAFIESLKNRYNEYNKSTQKTKDYNSIVPYTYDTKKKVYSNEHSENLENNAKSLANEKYVKKLEKTLNKDSENNNLLEKKSTDFEERANARVELAEERLNEEKQKLRDKLTKQGVADSSILTSFTKDGEKAIELIKRENAQLQANLLEEINTKRIEMSKSLESSLSFYRLEYAKDIMYNIEKLNYEENKIRTEVDRYNRQVDKGKAEYDKEYEGKIEKLKKEDEALENKHKQEERHWEEKNKTFKGNKLLEMNQRLEESLKFYNEFSKDTSLALIDENSKQLKEYLGVYYEELLKRIKKKR